MHFLLKISKSSSFIFHFDYLNTHSFYFLVQLHALSNINFNDFSHFISYCWHLLFNLSDFIEAFVCYFLEYYINIVEFGASYLFESKMLNSEYINITLKLFNAMIISFEVKLLI